MRKLFIFAAVLLLSLTVEAKSFTVVGGSAGKFLLVTLIGTDGVAETGVAFGSVTVSYTRNTAPANVAQTAITMTTPTHADWGWQEIDATNSPGDYWFGIPDAAIADGADAVLFSFSVTGVVPIKKTIEIVDVDMRNGANIYADTRTVEGTDATTYIESRTLAAADYFDFTTDTVTTDTASRAESKADVSFLDIHVSDVAFLVESQRSSHTWQGSVYFVDPVNGAAYPTNDGSRTSPLASVQDAHDNLVTDSNHDVIILISGAAAGPTTLDEQVNITKRYVFIRGPGRDFIWKSTSIGNVIDVTANGVELSGFQIETHTTGNGDAIAAVDADFLKVHDVWFNQTRGWGIDILRGSNCQILNNTFHNTGQDGLTGCINIKGTAGTSDQNKICYNRMEDITGDGVNIEDGTTEDTKICDNYILDTTGYAVDLQASSIGATVAMNVFGNNILGTLNDLGTETVAENNEQWAKHSIATEVRLAELDAANLPATGDAILLDTSTTIPDLLALIQSDLDIITGTDGVIISSAGVDLIWNEPLTKATHDVANSAAKLLRKLTADFPADGTVVSSTISTLTLDAGASPNSGAYDPGTVIVTDGTNFFARDILSYDGATRTLVLSRSWRAGYYPDASWDYVIKVTGGNGSTNEGLCAGGTANTITLNDEASDADDAYKNFRIVLHAGTGEDDSLRVVSYDGATRVATMDENWRIAIPVSGVTAYSMEPQVSSYDAWTAALTDYLAAGTFGFNLQNAVATGGDASLANQIAILSHLTDIKGTGWASTDNLVEIKAGLTGSGSGDTRVTKDFGTGQLYWTEAGTGVSEGNVRVYLASEYDVGIYTLRAFATTGDDGGPSDVWLDTGLTYVFEYSKSGYQTAVERITP